MNYPLKNGNILSIFQDDVADYDPRREYDHLGKMVCIHRRYTLGDKHNIKPEDHGSWESIRTYLIRHNDARVILPVYMYDHSGITISTSRTGCYADRWDSGQLGLIYASGPDIRREYSVKRITKKTLDKVRSVLEGEISEYDQYLRGEIYGYSVKTPAGEIIDSCYGFFGTDGILEEFKDQIREG